MTNKTKKYKQPYRLPKAYAVTLVIVTIALLAKFQFRSGNLLLVLVTLYLVSLVLSYAIHTENKARSIDYKRIFGFAVAIMLASFMACSFVTFFIYGL